LGMTPNASLKCLSRQEIRVSDKLAITLYRIAKEGEIGLPETSLEEVLASRPSSLVRYRDLKKVCRGSDAALISGDGMSLFIILNKEFPSIQLLKMPAFVREILVVREAAGNGVAGEESGSVFSGLRLRAEKIELGEGFVAFDSVFKGGLDDGIYALKVVGDRLDSVIIRDEIIKCLSDQGRLKTPPKKTSKKKRGRRKTRKKRRKQRRKTRKKASRKSRTKKR
jgi:hypothetical protein